MASSTGLSIRIWIKKIGTIIRRWRQINCVKDQAKAEHQLRCQQMKSRKSYRYHKFGHILLHHKRLYFQDQLYRVNGYDAFVSDHIAMDRSVKDIRHPKCREVKYLSKLPTVTVIFPFHNEVL